jgi:hypothetical protein
MAGTEQEQKQANKQQINPLQLLWFTKLLTF